MPSRGLCRDRSSGNSWTIVRLNERIIFYITIHI